MKLIYKKSGIAVAIISRDIFCSNIDDKITTISEYTKQLKMSRGSIQNALSFLESKGAIKLEKKGASGSFLRSKDSLKLIDYALWDSITGSMPVPLNKELSALATAVCKSMITYDGTFTFAFIQGAKKRLDALLKESYDFVVVSKSAIKKYMEDHNNLEIAVELKGSLYSQNYCLYKRKEHPDFFSGMKVAVDRSCIDQYYLTKHLMAGYEVEYSYTSYINSFGMFKEGLVDFLVYRKRDEEMADIIVEPLSDYYVNDDFLNPVVIVNKNNYAIKKLLNNYIKIKTIKELQEKVLSGQLAIEYF